MRRWRVTIYGPGVFHTKVSAQGQVTVRAWTPTGARRRAAKWYGRMKPGAPISETTCRRFYGTPA